MFVFCRRLANARRRESHNNILIFSLYSCDSRFSLTGENVWGENEFLDDDDDVGKKGNFFENMCDFMHSDASRLTIPSSCRVKGFFKINIYLFYNTHFLLVLLLKKMKKKKKNQQNSI